MVVVLIVLLPGDEAWEAGDVFLADIVDEDALKWALCIENADDILFFEDAGVDEAPDLGLVADAKIWERGWQTLVSSKLAFVGNDDGVNFTHELVKKYEVSDEVVGSEFWHFLCWNDGLFVERAVDSDVQRVLSGLEKAGVEDFDLNAHHGNFVEFNFVLE